MPQSPKEGLTSQKASTIPLPRRPSSALSDSQNSVQHHTIDRSSAIQDTPEWKRRLKEGEEIASDGFDLFSPSKLEGIFKQSSCPVEAEDNDEEDDVNDGSVLLNDDKKQPWNSLSGAAFPPPSEQFTSYRTSKSRPSGMDTLEEVDEEGEEKSFDLSAISSDIVKGSAIKGIVRRRVSGYEQAKTMDLPPANLKSAIDPRMRTISGRKEINDEVFSPVEDSDRSSIRRQALQESLDTDPIELRRKLMEARKPSTSRSRSRSSDHDISYDAPGLNEQDRSILPEEPNADMTSQSLPEDLSMGTQVHQPTSILEVITRTRKNSTRHPSAHRTKQDFRSSPPPYGDNHGEDSRLSMSEPSSPVDTSVVHHAPTSGQQSTAGSPLKLFGNRDTYTNKKLMRVLSQFEDEQSEPEVPAEIRTTTETFRMSNFGLGELDGFGFDKEVRRPALEELHLDEEAEKFFTELPLLQTQDSKATKAAAEASPTKERSPKRRRTLLKDEIFANGTELEIKVSTVSDNSLAGKKRRDALPGKDAEQASPDTLATRQIRRPSGSRKSSGNVHSRTASASEALQTAANIGPIQEQLAAELESFAKNAQQVKQDARKASLATKDYMEEANKVMEFIRARGKPKPPMPELQESNEVSELNPDAILDLEIDDESTKESFSRPPSREGRPMAKPSQRHAQHDTQTANHLNKYRDPDDLEILTSTSALGTLHFIDNKAVEEAALVPVPEDEAIDIADSFESEPPGMRILNDNDRKRKLSDAEIDSHNVHSDGSRRTVNTTSSASSGQRGMISQGTVSIPDTIGVMTFDRDRKIWVKQNLRRPVVPAPTISPDSKAGRGEVSEADPFDGIDDLSIDETKEQTWKKSPIREQPQQDDQERNDSRDVQEESPTEPPPTTTKVPAPTKSSLKSPRRLRPSEDEKCPRSKSAEASKREERLHEGVIVEDIDTSGKHQPRVVTIAFSSPIASEIPYARQPSLSTEADLDEDDPSLLPLDDEGSVLASSPSKSSEEEEAAEAEYDTTRHRPVVGSTERHEQYRAMTLNRRPVSRIEEYDEEQVDNQDLSLIHINHTEITPMPDRQLSMRKASIRKESSILCLTPLSEFTLHQVDKLNHPEESFIAERANPKALRQAHGSHALVEDALVKAITDAEPSELYWEQLRTLTLRNGGLESLHGLRVYCSALEYLDVTGNRVAQLTDLPVSLRSLSISSNLVNDLTSWTHLNNLQSIDVSRNQLESLQCFSGLIHLRHLKASGNKIRNADGILKMTGLITLDLAGNDIPEVDFSMSELTSLEKLDLSRNKMMHINNLEYLRTIRDLDLTDNLLEEVIINVNRVVPQLSILCLAQNELSELDLTAFPRLQRLNIDGNMITKIHGLEEAEHLTVLSARDQRATSNLVNDILDTSHDCTELYLSANALPDTGLVLLNQQNFTLRCLELASCGIQSIPQGFGDRFPNMRVLNLNFNGLADLSPLQGSIKLKHLYVARNRLQKMRRTCLTLSRLRALRKVDLRDNPLTIGFYTPVADEIDATKPHRLPVRIVKQDQKWLGLMDEMTWLRRRTMELLLADCCPGIEELDGLMFDRDLLIKEKTTWERLMKRGVLKKERETTVSVLEVPNAQNGSQRQHQHMDA